MAPIRRPPVIARYLLKVPLRALDLPIPEGADVMLRHVVLNGGRLVSSTRGFWKSVDGEPVGGLAQARRAARDAWVAGWRPS
jgi:hypothetical protein